MLFFALRDVGGAKIIEGRERNLKLHCYKVIIAGNVRTPASLLLFLLSEDTVGGMVLNRMCGEGESRAKLANVNNLKLMCLCVGG